ESKLFTPFRAAGLVTSNKPFIMRYYKLTRKTILKVPVGNAFYVYDANKLSLLALSDHHQSAITSLESSSSMDFSGTENGLIYCWNSFTEFIHHLEGHTCAVQLMSSLGNVLLSIDISNNMKVWDVKDKCLYSEIHWDHENFNISVVCHPPTYLNKVLLGSKQGKLRLLNLKTSKIIYEFEGWGSSVTVLEPAPALDVVAVGLEDGQIIIHNLKFDETVMTLKQDWGKVTTLSFRSDNNSRLLSGSSIGHLAVWDLNERNLSSVVENAHSGPIITLTCAKGDPFAFSSSTDNAIKSWIFDLPDGGARLNFHREGHSEPPLKVRFHGASDMTMISGGQDSSMRVFLGPKSWGVNMGLACYNRKEVKKKNLKFAIKMPPIIHFTTETTREEAWDSIAAVHLNAVDVSTWSFHRRKMNERLLKHPRFKDPALARAMATCITISVCGNFVFIGYNTGHVDKYNIQSGAWKHCFENNKNVAVRGLVTDSLNQWIVTGDQEGTLQWWGFSKGDKDKALSMEAGVFVMTIHRDSGLFAAALDDWSIVVLDIDTKSVVRNFYGHLNQITDMVFSSDSKWLISSSMDHSIRTFDLPSGSCIDHFTVPKPASSIALSPADEYLVSTHVDELGLYMWANRNWLSFVSLQPLKEDYVPPLLSLPATAPDVTAMDEYDSDDSDTEHEDIEVDDYVSPDQVSEDFVSIDLVPSSRWLNLANIDQIKKRSKPHDAPKVPKSAPFFLESVLGIEAQINETNELSDELAKSKIIDKSQFVLETLSPFGTLLKKGDHAAAFEKLSKMSPSNIDIEIRNLDPELGGSRCAMLQFLLMITDILKSRQHFELAQGYLSLFLKRH
ncbi:WD40 repeat, partial [Trinorchestia longiramus]